MKKILPIVFVFIIPFSGMQISLDRHYCSGSLADVRISVSGKLASCGMEKEEPVGAAFPVLEKNCCQDDLTYYRLAGQYLPEQFKLKIPVWNKAVLTHPHGSLISTNEISPKLISYAIWSADDNRHRLKPPDICVFRI